LPFQETQEREKSRDIQKEVSNPHSDFSRVEKIFQQLEVTLKI
jgi:hypothetical protein